MKSIYFLWSLCWAFKVSFAEFSKSLPEGLVANSRPISVRVRWGGEAWKRLGFSLQLEISMDVVNHVDDLLPPSFLFVSLQFLLLLPQTTCLAAGPGSLLRPVLVVWIFLQVKKPQPLRFLPINSLLGFTKKLPLFPQILYIIMYIIKS